MAYAAFWEQNQEKSPGLNDGCDKTSSHSSSSTALSSLLSNTPFSSSLSGKTSSYSSSGTPLSSSLSSKTSSYSSGGTPLSSSLSSKTSSYSSGGTPSSPSLSSKTSTYSASGTASSSIKSGTPPSSTLRSKTSTYSAGGTPSSSITSSLSSSTLPSSKTSSYQPSGTPSSPSFSSKTSTYSAGGTPSSSITSSVSSSTLPSSNTSSYQPSGTPLSSSLSSKTSTYSSGGTPPSSVTSNVSSSTLQSSTPLSTLPSSKTSSSTGGLSSAYSPRPYVSKSQPGQATPKPAAQVSTVKPAQFETSSSASAIATKPGEVTTATTTTGGGVTVGGSAAVGVGKPETASMSQVKAPATVPSALTGRAGTAGRATTTTTSTAASTPTAPSTAPTAGSTAPGGAVTSALTQTKDTAKVQVEVPSAVKDDKKSPAVDPFDALASILPSSDLVVRPQPEYTGPEVTEIGITAEEGVICGGSEATLPPGYRLEDMPPPPADWKPRDVPKPLSTDEALDSLSSGFMTSTAPTGPTQQKKPTAGSGDALDLLAGDFTTAIATPVICTSPPQPPAQTQDLVDNVVSASAGPVNYGKPPADKKPKMEKGLSYIEGITATPFKKSSPPIEKKVKGDSVSSDALSALGDLLPVNVPKPEPPKLRPEDLVSEAKHKEEEAVFVGERDDSINPKYRFNREELEKLPAPKPEPTIGTNEALDILSGGFVTAMATPAICTSPPLPAAQKLQAPLADDFSLEGGLTATTAKKVESSAAPPPPERRTRGTSSTKGDAMSQGALGALGDLLPSDAPKPELPKLRPEDIVSEKKHTEEEAVFVGEREDSINPKYKFDREKLEKLPAPKLEPTMATEDALDILSGGFVTSATAPAVQSSMVQPGAPPAQQGKVEDLSALDLLSGDLVAPTKAFQSHAAGPPATKKGAQDTKLKSKDGSISLDALSDLSDMLPANIPRPKSPELRPEDMVKEDKHKEEDAVLVGERDDSIHPNYRFDKEALMKLPPPKPEPTMGTGEALDLLSGEFLTSSAAPAVQAPLLSSTALPTKSSADLAGEFVTPSAAVTLESVSGLVPDPELELDTGAYGALDALSNTLEDIKPTPMPEPALPKNLVDEKKAVEERLIKMGETEESLPPEYRLTEEDLKKMAEAKAAEKPKPSLDDKTALDMLSMDFTNAPRPPAAGADTTKLEAPVLDSNPLKPMPGPVLKNLSDTLLPDVPEFKTKTDKAKKHAEEPKDERPSQSSSDVVPASTKKGGRR